ncbi:cytidine deaminase [Shewanella intestini]|uniref:Cytidine deaminase n=1 Tax=Shewanella intestini TaxID=2017544 RepID=A0ABS5I172_9GAMM|nr:MULTISPECIES: cytidine deaminase [Shewanella]MBR9727771.1 cytidine deaminase [Shewanella intestini]MRG36236.1 cytidine deaminase [Shewanella sp. XMDDZSB0408]
MQPRFIHALSQLSDTLSAAITPLLKGSFSGFISAQAKQALIKQTNLAESQLLIELLPIAAALASPKLSEFYVGAIAVGETGDIYMGANLELPAEALFHTVHAEQSAIGHAWLMGEQRIVDIVVNFSPCGHCRQFMNELVDGQQIKVHLPGQDTQALSHYLPYAFGPSDLQVSEPLLTQHSQPFTVQADDSLCQEAVKQLCLSYAPYTQNYSAVVLQMHDDTLISGRYAENAAFNPSMQPMQMAFSSLLRHNYDYTDIKRALLVESAAGKVSNLLAAKNALNAVCAIELEHLQLTPE